MAQDAWYLVSTDAWRVSHDVTILPTVLAVAEVYSYDTSRWVSAPDCAWSMHAESDRAVLCV